MKNWLLILLATTALTACGGTGSPDSATGGLGGGGGTGGETPGGGGGGGTTGDGDGTIDGSPDSCTSSALTCRGDVLAVSMNDDETVLSITGLPFDESPVTATYTRAAGLDVSTGSGLDFKAYVNNDSDRINDYIALYQTSPDGSVTVGVVGIEGYNLGYKGEFYRLNSEADLPSTGLVVYTGTYAGLMDFNGDGSLYRTSGDMEIDADYTDNVIKGFVSNRVIIELAEALPTLILNDTPLVDGTFSGVAVSYDGGEVLESGSYLGLIGGTNAETVGGVIEVTNPKYDEANKITSRDTGVFITTR